MALDKYRDAKIKIQKVLDLDRNARGKTYERLFEVNSELAGEILKATGIDVTGYRHSIDRSEVNHAIRRHTNKQIEASRGQIPITADDFLLIPNVIDRPDKIRFLGIDRQGRKTIALEKFAEDGNIIIYETILTGRKALAFTSLMKKRVGGSVLTGPAPTSETVPHPNSK
jgi:hypothetical protein